LISYVTFDFLNRGLLYAALMFVCVCVCVCVCDTVTLRIRRRGKKLFVLAKYVVFLIKLVREIT